MEESLYIEGKNSVMEAIRAGKTIERITMEKGKEKTNLADILAAAKERGIDVRFASATEISYMTHSKNPQGVVAKLSDYRYYEVDEILADAREKNEPPFILILDEIEDPHNFGAILRTAHLMGAHGVIIPKDRSATLNATVARASAGAIHYIKVARVTNLVRTIEELKKEGLWFTVTDMDGKPVSEMDFSGPTGLVIGNEGKGVSRLIRETCDFTASIPMRGKIDSLNASVAAGIFCYEVMKQRSGR